MQKISIRKRIFIMSVLAILLVITLVMAFYILNIYHQNFGKGSNENTYDQYYVMITENDKSGFWQSVYRGMHEKGIENNIYVELLGENLRQHYSKEDLMRIAIASGVDGIVIEADEGEEMTKLINEAVKEDIAVVTVYSDNTQSSRCSFVSVGSYDIGREYALEVLKLTEGKEKPKVTVLLNANQLDSSQNILVSGISKTLEKEGRSDIEMVFVPIDNTNVFSAEESIRNMLLDKTQPDIFICLDETSTVCVYQAVVDYNKVGQVNILGYYDSDTILNAIDRNVISATISVDTEQMGDYCLEALMDYLEYGNTNQYFMADVALVNKGNVAEYLGGPDEETN